MLNTFWNREKAAVTTFIGDEPFTLVGDGRCDFPVHNAKYCTYSLEDVNSRLLLDFSNTQLGQEENSQRLEKHAFINAVRSARDSGINIHRLPTDRHPSMVAEDPEFNSIN